MVGENYLEKIVQLPFELPVPEKSPFRSMFFRKLDALLGDISEVFIDQMYWANLYLNGIDYLITTPRDINRLINTLSITYPIVKGEVNPYDFIAIEAIRITYPEIYDSIRKQEDMFIGMINKDGISASSLEVHKSFHEGLLADIKEERKKCIKNILTTLFPKLHEVYGTNAYGHSESDCRKKLRICSTDIFPRYFRMAIPLEDLSSTEMNAILALLYDPKAFSERLEGLSNHKLPDGSTKVHIFLERLRDYTDGSINSDKGQRLINSLLDVGDKLIRPEDEFHNTRHKSFYDLSNDSLMRFRIMDLLKQLKNEERFKTLRNAFLNGRAVTMPVEVVRQIGKEYGKYDPTGVSQDKDHIISEEDLGILEDILLKKIRVAAKDQSLIKTPHLPLILHSWKQLGEEEKEIQAWMKRTIITDEGLFSILESFLTKCDTNLGIRYGFNPDSLKPYVEPFDLIDRVSEISKKNDALTDMQKIAATEFIKGCENKKQAEVSNEGDNP